MWGDVVSVKDVVGWGRGMGWGLEVGMGEDMVSKGVRRLLKAILHKLITLYKYSQYGKCGGYRWFGEEMGGLGDGKGPQKMGLPIPNAPIVTFTPCTRPHHHGN